MSFVCAEVQCYISASTVEERLRRNLRAQEGITQLDKPMITLTQQHLP